MNNNFPDADSLTTVSMKSENNNELTDSIIKRGNNPLKGILIFVGLSFILCVGSGFYMVENLRGDTEAILQVVDHLMIAGKDNDSQQVHSLFYIPHDSNTITEAVENSYQKYKSYFGDYKSMQLDYFNEYTNGEGTFADIAGTISYSNRPGNTFTARLIKRSNKWLVMTFHFDE